MPDNRQQPFLNVGLTCTDLLQMPSLPLAAFPPSPEPQEGAPQAQQMPIAASTNFPYPMQPVLPFAMPFQVLQPYPGILPPQGVPLGVQQVPPGVQRVPQGVYQQLPQGYQQFPQGMYQQPYAQQQQQQQQPQQQPPQPQPQGGLTCGRLCWTAC